MMIRDNVEAGQGNAHPQQEAAEEPKRRLFVRSAPANCPPKTAKKTAPSLPPPPMPAPESTSHSSLSSLPPHRLVFLGDPVPRIQAADRQSGHSSASVQPCLPEWCLSNQRPSAAPSSVGTTTDQPISPIMPKPNQTPFLEFRRALSLRAAFAPTSPAKVGPLSRLSWSDRHSC